MICVLKRDEEMVSGGEGGCNSLWAMRVGVMISGVVRMGVASKCVREEGGSNDECGR